MTNHVLTIPLPDIGEGVVEGEIIEWLKQEGEAVAKDEPVVVVMTDKATVELPSPYAGVIAKHYYEPGQIAHKGKPLYAVRVEGYQEQAPIAPAEPKSPTQQTPRQAPQPITTSGKALASPVVRKLAKEIGIDINQVHGTGSEGHVTATDLQKAVRTDEKREKIPLTGIRRAMARSMTESHQQIASFSYFETVDATRLIQLRLNLSKKGKEAGQHVTYMPLFIRALSRTLSKHPLFNSSFLDQEESLVKHPHHHIGIAVSTAAGLNVPVLHEVDKLSFKETVQAYNELMDRVKKGRLSQEDMKHATFSISNFGVLGSGTWATPIIPLPQIGILAVARICKEPYLKNGRVEACDVLHLSWTFDHRVIDGDMAAAFSSGFAQLIKNPASLL